MCSRFLFVVLVEGVWEFDAVAMCRRLHGKNRRGLELKRIELGSIPYFPGAGCSGLNNPDSGVWAGDLLYIRLHRLERDAEADGSGPLAATSIGRGRKYQTAAICRLSDGTQRTARDMGIGLIGPLLTEWVQINISAIGLVIVTQYRRHRT